MGWRRNAIEFPIWLAGKFRPASLKSCSNPDSIFVLRNNDIGDLLVVTPLFEALRKRFPEAKIAVGIGSWNEEVLANNPNINEIVSVNAPWSNKYIAPQDIRAVAKYLFASAEMRRLAERHFDIGIDILGSHYGSVLMLRAGIPCRLGVRGYRGGHTATQKWVNYNPSEHVARSALRFAELLGATEIPAVRPQLFLTDAERERGEQQWTQFALKENRRRLVIGPGGGFEEKCWPKAHFVALLPLLARLSGLEIAIVGGKQDRELGERLAALHPAARNFAGQLTLRETFELVAAADMALCNPSVLMHIAAAFSVPTLVLLGDYFPSATQHDQQWGYAELCRSLGKEAGRTQLYTPEEVFDEMRNFFPL